MIIESRLLMSAGAVMGYNAARVAGRAQRGN